MNASTYVCVHVRFAGVPRAGLAFALVHRPSKVLHGKERWECLNLHGHSSPDFNSRPGPRPKRISFK